MMSVPAIASEFELELCSERSRWLRRRLMWLCGTGAFVTLVGVVSGPGSHQYAAIVQRIESLVVVAIYVYAFAAAGFLRLRERSLLQLAFWLVVAVAVVGLIGSRLILFAPDFVTNRRAIASAAAMIGIFLVGSEHLIACLFMPWTARESLRLAGLLLAILVLTVVFDAAFHLLGARLYLTIPALATVFVPGIVICWWRYSRFRRRFKLQFESARYRLIQGELASARHLHEAALPAQRTQGPLRLHYVYEPMRQIGGDLLFVTPSSPDAKAMSIVVLDVTGHGIPAALTVNRLIGELERLFAESPDSDPHAILLSLNRYVALTLSRHNIYVTALCLRIDCDTGELLWANGGHPPAFICRADGRLEHINSSVPLLGVLNADEFYNVPATPALMLNRGDVLLAYTDGLCEACNPDGRQLGIDGVKDSIAALCANGRQPHDWPRALLDATLAYRQSPVEDDTLVVALYRSVASS